MDHSLRLASSADIAAAGAVLAEAFHDYPWTRWVLPEEDYEVRLAEIQGLYLAHALEHGLVIIGGAPGADERGVRAVAAFLPADAPAPAPAVQQRIAELHGHRLERVLSLETPDAPEGCWSLETVGVPRAHRGAGLGGDVVGHGLSLIDRDGTGIALETSDERNVRLYRRLGFETFATTRTPGAPVIHSMHRPPAPMR